MKLQTKKVKEVIEVVEPVNETPTPNYIVKHYDVNDKKKITRYKTLPEARKVAIILYRAKKFIELSNLKGVKLPI